MKKKKESFGISIDDLSLKINSLKKDAKEKIKTSYFENAKQKQLKKSEMDEHIENKLTSEVKNIIRKNIH